MEKLLDQSFLGVADDVLTAIETGIEAGLLDQQKILPQPQTADYFEEFSTSVDEIFAASDDVRQLWARVDRGQLPSLRDLKDQQRRAAKEAIGWWSNLCSSRSRSPDTQAPHLFGVLSLAGFPD